MGSKGLGRVALFGVVALCFAACAGDTGSSVRGDYLIAGAAFCEVREPGEPLEVFSVSGDVRITEVSDSSAPGCQHRLRISADLCPSCAPTSCELCLVEPTGSEGWTVGPGYPDTLELDSCRLVGDRGGPSLDLYVSGQDITGTFGPEGDNPLIRFDMNAQVATGITGTDRSATAHCEINTAREP